ncbi:hypothetical protein, partial [Bacteroides cellulosilyticus]
FYYGIMFNLSNFWGAVQNAGTTSLFTIPSVMDGPFSELFRNYPNTQGPMLCPSIFYNYHYNSISATTDFPIISYGRCCHSYSL